jgi:hypothetical protein
MSDWFPQPGAVSCRHPIIVRAFAVRAHVRRRAGPSQSPRGPATAVRRPFAGRTAPVAGDYSQTLYSVFMYSRIAWSCSGEFAQSIDPRNSAVSWPTFELPDSVVSYSAANGVTADVDAKPTLVAS